MRRAPGTDVLKEKVILDRGGPNATERLGHADHEPARPAEALGLEGGDHLVGTHLAGDVAQPQPLENLVLGKHVIHAEVVSTRGETCGKSHALREERRGWNVLANEATQGPDEGLPVLRRLPGGGARGGDGVPAALERVGDLGLKHRKVACGDVIGAIPKPAEGLVGVRDRDGDHQGAGIEERLGGTIEVHEPKVAEEVACVALLHDEALHTRQPEWQGRGGSHEGGGEVGGNHGKLHATTP